MSDITKMIKAGNVEDPDKFDRARELADWSRDTGLKAAKAEGLELGEEHWAVIYFLRAHYVQHGHHAHARELADILDEHFTAQGGRKHLYQLFPGGPVTQGGRIAGIPVPPDSRQPSFGSVF